ncbi:MAG: hypothetical protein ACTHNT_03140 [Actinomycetales bacterium]
MPTPRSVRFDDSTVTRLAAYVRRHPGLSSSSAAALLVEEGLRMDEFPGIVFRSGPTGRRAAVVGGPDVWEVIREIRSLRDDAAGLTGERLLERVAEDSCLPLASVRSAISYYSAFPDEIDSQLQDADAAEHQLAETLARKRGLLGA